jgi:Spy/CpxP family protein refolding chaperone
MKYLVTLILLSSFTLCAQGQDIFKNRLYDLDLIMAHRGEIELTEDQKTKIRSIYRENGSKFDQKKWELYDLMDQLKVLLDQPTVDESKATRQLDQILKVENEIKQIKFLALLGMKNVLTADQQEVLDR